MAPVAALLATADELRRLDAAAAENGWPGGVASLDAQLDPGEPAVGLPVATTDGDVPVVAWQCPLAGGRDEAACVVIGSRAQDLDELARGFVPLALASSLLGAAGELLQDEELGSALDLTMEGETTADTLVFPELFEEDEEEGSGAGSR